MSIRDTAWHSLAGNDAPPVAVGFTRGILATGLASIANTILILAPMDAEAKVQLMAAMNGALIMASYVVYAFLEPWFKRHASTDDEGDGDA